MKMTYRVSHYRDRGTELVFDHEYSRKAQAEAAFHALAASHIDDVGHCILLSRNNNTLCAKSTDERWVQFYPSYYRKA